jgi:malonyl-CoA decarboxylase
MPSSVAQSCVSAPLRAADVNTATRSSAEVVQSIQERPLSASLQSPRDASRTIECCEALLSARGEVSGATLANEALAAYRSLSRVGLGVFFDFLVNQYSPDQKLVERCGEAYREEPSHANLIRLRQAVESPRQELFRRLNLGRNGTASLVNIRRRVLRGLNDNPKWAAIEAELAHLLRSWFNGGFLELRRINWRTPDVVLQKLMKNEAVHRIRGWRDMRRRLQADRRCFALFHPALPDEPIVFTELALTTELSASVQPLLDPDSPVRDASSSRCAIFYSISSCHEGLRGIAFGNTLIRRVVEQLHDELPRLKIFATLSPVPGFRPWLTALAKDGARTSPDLVALVDKLETSNWLRNDVRVAELKKTLIPLCAFYLLQAKRGLEPADSVARFHIGNGAQLGRLNWLSDCSKDGLQRSAGLTANYLYRLSELDRNHQTYAVHHTVAASPELQALAKSAASEIINIPA